MKEATILERIESLEAGLREIKGWLLKKEIESFKNENDKKVSWFNRIIKKSNNK